MTLDGVWKFLHLFFAFSFVGTLVLADWNGRALRASRDWAQRALLLEIIHLSTRTAGLGSLVLLGLFGNLVSMNAGYTMRADTWLRWVNGLWLPAVLIAAFWNLPALTRLRVLAKGASGTQEIPEFDAGIRRWRLGNAVLSLLYVALLILMVFRWRS